MRRLASRILRRTDYTRTSCRRRACRNYRVCGGDPHVCPKRALDGVPSRVQSQARQDILAATPRNIAAPERETQQRMPRDFYE
jgi:hypothetical protein